MLEPKAAEGIVKNNIHRAKFAKAVNEMNIWQPPISNMKILKDVAFNKENISKNLSSPELIERITPRLTRSKAKLLQGNKNNECIFETEPTRVLRPRKR